MPNELSGDAELTAQCTATRMFAIYQSTALFWALAEKKLIDPQHVFALGFEEMAANISADDTQRLINQHGRNVEGVRRRDQKRGRQRH
jgi:hypothetical protein